MTKQLIVGLMILFFPFTSQARFFGPSNFEECVVDKMKGQDIRMRGMVEDACEIKFPFEKDISGYFSAKNVVGGIFHDGFNILQEGVLVLDFVNKSKYKITSGVYLLTLSECDESDGFKKFEEVSLTPSPNNNSQLVGKVSEAYKNSKCGKFAELYGKRIK